MQLPFYAYPRKTIFLALVPAGLILLLILAYLLAHMAKYQRRKNKLAQAAVCEKLLQLEQQSAALAMGLHDDIGNAVTAIRLLVEAMPQNPELQAVENRLGSLVDWVRAITFQFLPEPLENRGLLPALRKLLAGVPLKVFVAGGNSGLPKDKEVQLFRIMQELLGNTLKHAKAAEINIIYQKETNVTVLSYSDNGIGFIKGGVQEGRGLRNIALRAFLLQANTYLHTTPGKGTSWRFEVPNYGHSTPQSTHAVLPTG